MTACDICGREAATFVRYNGTHLCPEHFMSYVERRVKREIRKQIDVHRGDRIAVAVSGGKDSMVALRLLSSVFNERNGVEVHAITIDEGIDGYRPPSVDIVRRFCDANDVGFHLRSFSELGVTMDEVAPVCGDSSPCTYCGVFRRMLMNGEARDIGARFLATGHNLDDTAQSVMMNFVRGDVDRLARMAPHQTVMPGLVPRFMPLREIPEKETLLYAILSGTEFWDGTCPYWEAALRNQYRDVIDGLEDRSPGARYGILSSFDAIRPMLWKDLPRSDLHPCPRCGEPTVGDSCKSCQLLDRARSRIRNR
ncbi:MAG: TIGR00269 family protein [Thermoplasmata archaeon]|nr:TIGR00269 family protein [Thermoplasmata archaeon]